MTGKTVRANLARVPSVAALAKHQAALAATAGAGAGPLLFSCAAPLAPPGHHLTIVSGNLAPESAVVGLFSRVVAVVCARYWGPSPCLCLQYVSVSPHTVQPLGRGT